jgi:hypothetical protein
LASFNLTYQSQTPSVDIGSGTADIPLAVSMTGLNSDTLYHYRVVVSNSGGITYGSDQQFVTNPGLYDNWKAIQFTTAQLGNAAISGDTADPAGDGIPNVLKYALGLNPMASSVAGLPVIRSAIVSGTDCLTLTYTKMDAATDITYIPEWSSDLVNWSNSGLLEFVLSDNGTSQQVQDSIPITSSAKIFLHLRITRP